MSGMQQICNVLLSLGLFTGVCSPQANAAERLPTSENGQIAATLQTKLDAFLLGSEGALSLLSLYGEGEPNPQTASAEAHIKTYCNPNSGTEKSAFICKAKGTPDDPYLSGGDIKASVLLEQTNYTDAVGAAARTYVRNLIVQQPSSKFKDYVSNENFLTDVTQQRAYSTYLANQALLGISLYSFNEMFGMRVKGSVLGATGNAESKSLLQVMETETTQRFTDPNFAAFLNDAATDQLAVQKELATMQAVQLWMSYQMYRQNERMEAILAAILSKNANDAIMMTSQMTR